MTNAKENRIEKIISETAQYHNAKLPESFFDKITTKVLVKEAKIISIFHLRVAAVAACLLVMVNVWFLSSLENFKDSDNLYLGSQKFEDNGLLRSFNIYDL